MPTTYVWTNTASDLAGGTDWTRLLEVGGVSGAATFSVANGSSETSLGFTDVDHPSNQGGTGAQNYTVKMNVTSGNAAIFCKVSVARVDSAGNVQTTSAETAEQTMTTGLKTFAVNSANLGTFAVGDRLRVNYVFRSSQSMGGAASITVNGAGNEVIAPWALSTQHTRSVTDPLGITDDHLRLAGSSRGADEGISANDEATYEHTPGSLPPIEVVVVRRVVGVLTDIG